MALFDPCMKFEIFLGQSSLFQVLRKCHSWTLSKMCLRLHPSASSKWIKVDKLDYLKNPSQELKKPFLIRVSMNPQKDWKAKLEREGSIWQNNSVQLVHFVFSVNVREIVTIMNTGGRLLVRFPLVRFLAYVRTKVQVISE